MKTAIKKIISFLSGRLMPSDRAAFLKLEAARALEKAYPPNSDNYDRFDYHWFKYASLKQSLIFYSDILPVLADWLFRQPRGSTFRLLDVGGATGGSSLERYSGITLPATK
jgi:hypothetical protein